VRRKPLLVAAIALTATAGVGTSLYEAASAAEPAGLQNLSVINTSTKQAAQTLTDGTTISLADPAGKNLTLQANPASGASVGSVKFTLTGPGTTQYTHLQNVVPYHLCNDYQACAPMTKTGDYSVSVQAYTKADAGGDQLGSPLVRTFHVVKSASGGGTSTPTPTPTATTDKPLKVLFIGNSLIGYSTAATNEDTTALTKDLAADAGHPIDVTKVIHFGNTLQETWDAGEIAPALANGKTYDRIVLQEQSTLVAKSFSKAESSLLNTLAPALKDHLAPGGKVLLFENWALTDHAGFATRADNVKAIETGYAKLSSELPLTNEIIPISDAFEKRVATDGTSSVIQADGRHPTDEAKYMDAAVIYGQLFHTSPKDLDNLFLDAGKAADLRTVAAQVLGY
jgi:hypothetical protein